MHGNDVDVLADLRIEQPGRPGFRRRHLDAVGQRVAHALDIGVELIGADIAAPHGLVADDDPVDDAAVGERVADAEFQLPLVLVEVGADPDPQRHRHAVTTGDVRQLVEAVRHRVGAHMRGQLGNLRHVPVELLGRRPLVLFFREVWLGL